MTDEIEKEIITLINSELARQWQNITPVGRTDEFPKNIIDFVRIKLENGDG